MLRVTSRHNPRLAEAAALISSSRDRRKAGRCVLEGEHLIEVYLDRGGVPEALILVDERVSEPRFAALAARVRERDVLAVPAAIFAEISTLPAAVGVLAIIATPAPVLPPSASFHLLLEDVQDPGNVGAMLRTAAAAGVEQVLLSKHCAFAWAPKVLRSAQGAHFLTTIVEDVDLVAWARAFRRHGRVVAAVAHGGEDLYATEFPSRVAIAIGNEGAGLSAALVNEAGARLTIPMPGGAESLNAGAAAAVVLFECVRQGRPRAPFDQLRTAEKRVSSRQFPGTARKTDLRCPGRSA
jgi:TrmH family RNA methyltransferase